MAFGNRGVLSHSGDIMQVNNALIEEISTSNNNRTGSIIISYVDYSANGMETMNLLQLNVTNNTTILNLTGASNCICSLQEGMWVDAIFSPRMTRSIPPQTNAFLIIARRGLPASTNTTTERIISVDTRQNTILTGNSNNANRQMLFNLSNDTPIRNRTGNPISLSDLRPGQMVRIIHANFQTASIPPQTTAFYVQLL